MSLRRFASSFALVLATVACGAHAQVETPDALVKRVSTDVLDAARADPSIEAGNVDKVVALVDAKILPAFDFEKMTASAVGPRWNEATPEQKRRLQDEFKILLVRAYSGALAQSRGRTVEIQPMRGATTDPQVVVRTRVTGRGDPVQLDFRLASEASAWKIHDVNVGGVWLVENYRGNFSQQIASGGIDGLIARLAERNKGARN